MLSRSFVCFLLLCTLSANATVIDLLENVDLETSTNDYLLTEGGFNYTESTGVLYGEVNLERPTSSRISNIALSDIYGSFTVRLDGDGRLKSPGRFNLFGNLGSGNELLISGSVTAIGVTELFLGGARLDSNRARFLQVAIKPHYTVAEMADWAEQIVIEYSMQWDAANLTNPFSQDVNCLSFTPCAFSFTDVMGLAVAVSEPNAIGILIVGLFVLLRLKRTV